MMDGKQEWRQRMLNQLRQLKAAEKRDVRSANRRSFISVAIMANGADDRHDGVERDGSQHLADH